MGTWYVIGGQGDLLLVDGNCRARDAIEYQGAAAARDAVKKEALRKAGVGYDEVVAGKTMVTGQADNLMV